MRTALFFLALSMLPFAAANAANSPQFDFPVACTLGQNCWIVNYVDVDTGDNARDFTCSARTYNKHTGTDIGLRDFASMQDGVFVLTAMDGKVERVRDGEPDMIRSKAELKALETKECGNGILIDHGNDLKTLYCHLQEGSIIVRPGQKVVGLQPIAKIGQSGLAEFAHLHFEVIKDGKTLDPFTGKLASEGCDSKGNPLWRNKIPYMPAAIYAAGFSAGVPEFEAINRDAQGPRHLAADSPALVFWTAYFGAQKGDQISMRIVNPNGDMFSQRKMVQEKDRARQFFYVGRKLSEPMPPGLYTGSFTVTRENPDGEPLTLFQEKEITIQEND